MTDADRFALIEVIKYFRDKLDDLFRQFIAFKDNIRAEELDHCLALIRKLQDPIP